MKPSVSRDCCSRDRDPAARPRNRLGLNGSEQLDLFGDIAMSS
ncbi:hypothetical protein [Nocardia abscessus]|nr:hypothetical protein [Nocardia abscessus]